MAAMVRTHRQGDGIVAEELHSDGERPRRYWEIDPVDHTDVYARGLPYFATLIALVAPGSAWSARRLSAGAGMPRRTSARTRLHVSAVSRLEDAHLSFAQLDEWESLGRTQQLTALVSTARCTFGSGGFLAQMWVAEGRMDVAVDPTGHVWDLAASQIIVEEAGGRFTDVDGRADPAHGTAVVSNGAPHADTLRLLAAGGSCTRSVTVRG